jgi:hypothetical protein
VALVTASNDLILNRTRFEEDLANVPAANGTFRVDVLGGNHAGFGSYDAAGRVAALGPDQADGPMQIHPRVQWDMSAAAAALVASMSGAALPEPAPAPAPAPSPQGTSGGSHHLGSSPWAIAVAFALIVWRKLL